MVVTGAASLYVSAGSTIAAARSIFKQKSLRRFEPVARGHSTRKQPFLWTVLLPEDSRVGLGLPSSC